MCEQTTQNFSSTEFKPVLLNVCVCLDSILAIFVIILGLPPILHPQNQSLVLLRIILLCFYNLVTMTSNESDKENMTSKSSELKGEPRSAIYYYDSDGNNLYEE
jgi:hypothetical protein